MVVGVCKKRIRSLQIIPVKRLAIVTTHPIQYNAPWFKLLSQRRRIAVKVFYTWSQTEHGPKYEPVFQKMVEWDVPLLEGYDYTFVENVAAEPGAHHFKGINNPALNKSIENWKPDAILVIGWAYRSHLACLRYFKGKLPVLFRGDSTLLDETKGFKTVLRRIFLTWVYRHIDKALYVGANNKAYFKAHRVKESSLVPAYHAVDNDRFSKLSEKQKAEVAKFRRDLGIAESDFVLLFAGKFEKKKNPSFLLQLARRIPDRQFAFVLTGNGPLEDELKASAAQDSRIKFLPFQNQSLMPAVYALGSVFILPSHGPGETWGLAANEAMALGLPVVLSDKTGGAVDLVNGNGLIFSHGETEKVKAWLEVLKSDTQKFAQAKAASIAHIQKFSFQQLAEAVENTCGF